MSYHYVMKSDEGTDSPFVARMFFGVLELRNLIITTNNYPTNTQVTQVQFDHFYEPIRNSLELALKATRTLNNICCQLVEDGKNGELVVQYPNHGYELSDIKDSLIQKEFSSMVEHSAIAIKTHLQIMMESLFNLKIGFLFQKEECFNNEIEMLKSQGLSPLSSYLQTVRIWSDQLIREIWNEMKHGNWRLPPPSLKITSLPYVNVDLPQVLNIPVNQYAFQTINRCCILVEDLIVYGLQFQRYSPIGIMEISKSERHNHSNKRFKSYFNPQGVSPCYPVFKDDMEII